MLSNLKIRNMFRLAIGLLLMTGLNACIMNEGFEEPYETATASLRLSTRSSETRADDKDGLEADPYVEYTEDAIDRVSLFFFSSATTDAAPFFVCETKVTAKTATDLIVKIPEDKVNGTNFPGGKAYVYALVNLPEGVTVDVAEGTITFDGKTATPVTVSATLSALQEVWVGDPGFVAETSPATFVMRGGATVELKEVDNVKTVSGTVLLERLAAKIRLWANILDHLYIDKTTGKTIEESAPDFKDKEANSLIEKWEPVLTKSDGMPAVELYLNNLTQRGRIDGYVGAEDDQPDLSHANVDTKGARAIADYNSAGFQLNAADKQDSPYVYTHSVPYYSYPNAWLADSPGEQHRTHVVISVPWQRVKGDEREYRECYYSVPVNALTATTDNGKAEKANCLEPNCYYRIKVRIGMLGSANRGEAPEIDASCEVLPWTEADVNVSIRDHRYLVVNQKEWVMNNTSTLEIPFSSSHLTKVECYVNYFRYNDRWGEEPESHDIRYIYTILMQPDYTSQREHNSGEFLAWKNKVAGSGEGYYTVEYTNNDRANERRSLYCRPRYFLGNYYVGREHPYTFAPEPAKRGRNDAGKSQSYKDAWGLYKEKYAELDDDRNFYTDSVYSCTIDHDKKVINFIHPLVAWEIDANGDYVPKVKDGKLYNEFSRIEIIIKIKHADWDKNDGLYEETIYLTQYPAMYVEEDHNYGSITPNASGMVSDNPTPPANGNEYVLVNANTTYYPFSYTRSGLGTSLFPYYYTWNIYSGIAYEIGKDGAFGVTNSMSQFSDGNRNPNMYVIHTSRLSEEDEDNYEIGDPRSLTSNIYLSDESFTTNPSDATKKWEAERLYDYTFWKNTTYPNAVSRALQSGPKWNNGGKEGEGFLEHYYPTDETKSGDAGSKENFIAPVLRIASSFGKIQTLAKFEARRRCASYQEAGRPAGRWRLPTKAEVEYIATLAQDRIIPTLFGPASTSMAYYWTATGVVSVDTDYKVELKDKFDSKVTNADGGTISVRCVYDDWYWLKDDGTEDVVTPEESIGEGQPEDEYWGKVSTFYWGDKEKDNTQAQALARKYVMTK